MFLFAVGIIIQYNYLHEYVIKYRFLLYFMGIHNDISFCSFRTGNYYINIYEI